MRTRSHRVECSRIYVDSFYSKSTAALDDVLRKAFARKCCVTEEHHYVVLLVMLRQARAGLSALMTGAMAAVAAVQTSLQKRSTKR
jgi:hypothetical protein